MIAKVFDILINGLSKVHNDPFRILIGSPVPGAVIPTKDLSVPVDQVVFGGPRNTGNIMVRWICSAWGNTKSIQEHTICIIDTDPVITIKITDVA